MFKYWKRNCIQCSVYSVVGLLLLDLVGLFQVVIDAVFHDLAAQLGHFPEVHRDIGDEGLGDILQLLIGKQRLVALVGEAGLLRIIQQQRRFAELQTRHRESKLLYME